MQVLNYRNSILKVYYHLLNLLIINLHMGILIINLYLFV